MWLHGKFVCQLFFEFRRQEFRGVGTDSKQQAGKHWGESFAGCTILPPPRILLGEGEWIDGVIPIVDMPEKDVDGGIYVDQQTSQHQQENTHLSRTLLETHAESFEHDLHLPRIDWETWNSCHH